MSSIHAVAERDVRSPLRLVSVLIALALIAASCSASSTTVQPSQGSDSASAPSSDIDSSQSDAETATVQGTAPEPREPAVSVQPTAEPVDTPEPLPMSTTLASGGAVDSIKRVQFAIGDTTITDATIQSFIEGAPILSDRDETWLITDINVESLANGFGFGIEPDSVHLETANGDQIPLVSIYDAAGDRASRFGVSGRSTQDLRLVWGIDQAVTDVTGWRLVVTSSTITTTSTPLVLPLAGSQFARNYPIALVDGATAVLNNGTPSCGDAGNFNTVIERAGVDLEGLGQTSEYRVPAGERIVVIDVAISGTVAGASDGNCGQIIVWPDFILQADGQSIQPETNVSGRIEGLGTATITLSYQVPASASTFELLGGGDQREIAAWTLDLPPEVGEAGADLVPFDAEAGATIDIPAAPLGERPGTLITEEVASGGATGAMTYFVLGVGATTATSAEVRSFIEGAPEVNSENRTYLVTELTVESTRDGNAAIAADQFVLIDPMGRPHPLDSIYERDGNRAHDGPFFSDPEKREYQLMFETNGLVTNVEGWRLQIEPGFRIPLEMPLVGPADEAEFPKGFRVGDNAEIRADQFPGCEEGRMNASVKQIRLDIEALGDFGNSQERAVPSSRYIKVDLLLENLVDMSEITRSSGCDALVLWPEFLLDADGRLQQDSLRESFKVDFDEQQAAELSLIFTIPADTREICLSGGDDPTEIGCWLLKDAGEVLADFEAEISDAGTLITLDESLLFAFGSSTLQRDAFPALNRIAKVVNEQATGDIEISGHTDAIGDDASNQRLSEARADAVAQALIDAGVDADRLVPTGAGESQPVAPNANTDGSDNPAGRAENRRVEIFFTTG